MLKFQVLCNYWTKTLQLKVYPQVLQCTKIFKSATGNYEINTASKPLRNQLQEEINDSKNPCFFNVMSGYKTNNYNTTVNNMMFNSFQVAKTRAQDR